MKVTLKTIVLTIPALSKLAAEDISLRLAYRLKKNIAELQREADFFGEQRIKILEKYGTADESGNYTFEGDNEQKAIAELDELLDLEVEPVIEPLNILITEDLKLSVNDIGLLEAFIHFIDET
jgi:hypothetical protein